MEACGQAFEEWDSEKSPKMLLSDCVQLANTKLLERVAMDPTLDGMGSTFVGIFVRMGKPGPPISATPDPICSASEDSND